MTLGQTVITGALGLLAVYRGALTRTSRLRGSIQANLALRDSLPADSPSRATLTAHVDELVAMLVRREARQFLSGGTLGSAFGVTVTLAVMLLLSVILQALQATGVYVSEPPSPRETWSLIAVVGAVGVGCAWFALRAWQQRERST
jgi:hypothetical protein